MSSEDVDAIREGYARFLDRGEIVAELMADDFVWDMSTFQGWPEQQTYEGIEGARQFMSSWLAAWDDWSLEVEELVDAGEGKVAAIVRQRGTSKAGVPVDMHFVQVWTLRDGLQTRMQMYASVEQAFEALGVSRDEP